MYVLGVAIGLAKAVEQVVTHSSEHWSWSNIGLWLLPNLAILPALAAPVLFPFNQPGWSLFAEISINIAFALILFKLSRTTNVMLFVMSGVLLVALAMIDGTIAGGGRGDSFVLGLARAAYSFILGMLISRFGLGRSFKVSGFRTVLIAIAIVVVLLIDLDGRSRLWFDFFAIFLAFPVLIVLATYTEPPRSLRKVCGFLGDMSYPVYAIHFPLIGLYAIAAGRLEPHPYLYAIAFMVVLSFSAWLALRYYDAPLRRRITRHTRSLPKRSSTGSPDHLVATPRPFE